MNKQKRIAYYKTIVDTFLPELEARPRDTKMYGKTEEEKAAERDRLIRAAQTPSRLPDDLSGAKQKCYKKQDKAR